MSASVAELDALARIQGAAYGLTREQREGLGTSEVRNIVTSLGDAILAELRRAWAAEREACLADVDAVADDVWDFSAVSALREARARIAARGAT